MALDRMTKLLKLSCLALLCGFGILSLSSCGESEPQPFAVDHSAKISDLEARLQKAEDELRTRASSVEVLESLDARLRKLEARRINESNRPEVSSAASLERDDLAAIIREELEKAAASGSDGSSNPAEVGADGEVSEEFMNKYRAAQAKVREEQMLQSLARNYDSQHHRMLNRMQEILVLSEYQNEQIKQTFETRKNDRLRAYTEVQREPNEDQNAHYKRRQQVLDGVDQSWRESVKLILDASQLAKFEDKDNRLDVSGSRSRIGPSRAPTR